MGDNYWPDPDPIEKFLVLMIYASFWAFVATLIIMPCWIWDNAR